MHLDCLTDNGFGGFCGSDGLEGEAGSESCDFWLATMDRQRLKSLDAASSTSWELPLIWQSISRLTEYCLLLNCSVSLLLYPALILIGLVWDMVLLLDYRVIN